MFYCLFILNMYGMVEKISSSSKKASQRILRLVVEELFPNTGTNLASNLIVNLVAEIKEDYDHPELRFCNSSIAMELDIFLPEYTLAF